MPDRELWPGAIVVGRAPYQLLEHVWVGDAFASHPVERFGDRSGCPEGEAGYHSATGKYLGIGRKHRRAHRAASREARHKCPLRIEIVPRLHGAYHLADRSRFTLAARHVRPLEPVEAEVGVVGALLLWIENREPILVSQS